MEMFGEIFKGQWTRYLVQFPFEWWVTLTFREPIKSEYAKTKLKAWTRKLVKCERLQLAYFSVINEVNRIHLHLLVLGRNRYGKTLLDVSTVKWERVWKAEAKISPIYNITGISKYFEGNAILKDDNLSEVILYNIKLLKKVQNTKHIEIYKNTDNTNLMFNEIAYQSAQDKESVKTQMVELINGFNN